MSPTTFPKKVVDVTNNKNRTNQETKTSNWHGAQVLHNDVKARLNTRNYRYEDIDIHIYNSLAKHILVFSELWYLVINTQQNATTPFNQVQANNFIRDSVPTPTLELFLGPLLHLPPQKQSM